LLYDTRSDNIWTSLIRFAWDSIMTIKSQAVWNHYYRSKNVELFGSSFKDVFELTLDLLLSIGLIKDKDTFLSDEYFIDFCILKFDINKT